MNTTEIETIFAEKLKIIKRLGAPGKNKDKIPEFNPVYKECIELKRKIEVHTELDKVPKDLMKRRAPYEDDRQFQYRKDNFEPVTMPYFMKAISKLNRMFNTSNYSIQWAKEQEDEQNYFKKEIPLFGSIETYFEEIVLPFKIIDPNGVLVVKPYDLPTVENEEGELVADDTKQIESVAVIVGCEKVIDYKEGEFCLIELEEKSLVKVGNDMKKEGLIFEFYDKQNIYRITQVGVKNEYKFDGPTTYYKHNLGYLPAKKLKGFPKSKELSVYYLSYFIYAVPLLNTALYSHTSLDMSMQTQMFPQRVEMVDRCDDPNCHNGYITEEFDEKKQTTVCKRCNGNGTLSKVGPMMVKQITVPDPLEADTSANNIQGPGVWYVAPDPATLQFVYEKYMEDIVNAFIFLCMNMSNSDVKGSETALGKQIDREELFSFLIRISNEVFQLMQFTIDAMGRMRFGSEFKAPVVVAPVSFSIRSEKELTEELIEGQKAGLPDAALREIIKELIAKRFANRSDIAKINTLVFGVDRFITKSDIVIAGKLAAGTAAKWEVVLHDSIFTFIEQIMIEDEKFFDKKFPEQKQKLIEMAKDYTKEIETPAKEVSPAV